MRCDECKFWEHDPGTKGGGASDNWKRGTCHRYPPTDHTVDSDRANDQGCSCFVFTDEEDWCGEFQFIDVYPVKGFVELKEPENQQHGD